MRSLKQIRRLLNEDVVRDEEHQEEAEMVHANLKQIIAQAKELHDLMLGVDDVEEWVQEKIAVAAHDIESILGYVKFYEELGEEEEEEMEDEGGEEEESMEEEKMEDEGDEEVEADVEVEEEEKEEEMPVEEKGKMEATKLLAEAFSYRLRSKFSRVLKEEADPAAKNKAKAQMLAAIKQSLVNVNAAQKKLSGIVNAKDKGIAKTEFEEYMGEDGENIKLMLKRVLVKPIYNLNFDDENIKALAADSGVALVSQTLNKKVEELADKGQFEKDTMKTATLYAKELPKIAELLEEFMHYVNRVK